MNKHILFLNVIISLFFATTLNIWRMIIKAKQVRRVQKIVSVLVVGMTLLGIETAFAEPVVITIDPFLANVGKFLGVPPEEIRLRHLETPGEFICIGPIPKPIKQIPDLPKMSNYCFSFVIKTEPPRALCNAYQQEYNELKDQLLTLIEAEAWDDVVAVAQRLSELENAISSTCQVRERAIKYCIFPDEWFDDPFAGGRTLPPKPPIPPLTPPR